MPLFKCMVCSCSQLLVANGPSLALPIEAAASDLAHLALEGRRGGGGKPFKHEVCAHLRGFYKPPREDGGPRRLVTMAETSMGEASL